MIGESLITDIAWSFFGIGSFAFEALFEAASAEDVPAGESVQYCQLGTYTRGEEEAGARRRVVKEADADAAGESSTESSEQHLSTEGDLCTA